MEFNEKLIELRKKEGLSQEELGYKLNVTRQTVSKWELGQTTPEMEKLIEMSKIFSISVDELINESDVQNTEIDTNIQIETETKTTDSNKKEKNMKILIIGILAIVVILIVIKMTVSLPIFNKVSNTIDNTANQQQNIIEMIMDMFKKVSNMVEQESGELQVEDYNNSIQMLSGTQMGLITNKCIDQIITNNNTNDKKIIVKYNEIETQDVNEIKDIKKYIDDYESYEISLGYDEEGIVNKVTIEKAEKIKEEVSEKDVLLFNFKLENSNGTKKGMFVKEYLDNVITSNKTNERKITVKYDTTETQDPEEIKNIKSNFEQLDDYEVSLDYDEDGFINMLTIEKL